MNLGALVSLYKLEATHWIGYDYVPRFDSEISNFSFKTMMKTDVGMSD